MDCNLRLELATKLVMTPQLSQAIAVLQLSSLELSALVTRELAENPALECDEAKADETSEASPEESDNSDFSEWLDYLDGRDLGMPPERREQHRDPEFRQMPGMTLRDYLLFQLQYAILDEAVRNIGRYVIECLNEDGYLPFAAEELGMELCLPVRQIEDVIGFIQTFDPPGVGARNLRECLRLQLDRQGMGSTLAARIVDDCLDQVAEGKTRQIAHCLGCSIQEVQQAVDMIRSLNPKPGRGFASPDSAEYILPDVVFERRSEQIQIMVNDADLPGLMVNPFFQRLLKDGNDGAARKFVEGRVNAAVWLIHSIEQRRRTLHTISEVIAQLQRDFLLQGPKLLRPLTLKQVADGAGVHESTVSRAIANKYAQTPFGLFPMRVFFSAGLTGANGEVHAASAVKRAIRELITAEDPYTPLSDQVISEKMGEKGIRISRRTVAKYREEMGIAAAAKRRRY